MRIFLLTTASALGCCAVLSPFILRAMLRKLLLSTNLWPGLAAASLSLLSFSAPLSRAALLYAAFMLFATASAYSYMHGIKFSRYGTGAKSEQGNLQLPVFHFSMAVINGLLALSFFYLIYSPGLLFLVLPAAVVSLLYPLAFPFPLRGFTALRTTPMLKLLLISATWAYLSHAVPTWWLGQSLRGWHLADFGARLLLVAALTIPFDVRDLGEDPPSLRTLPQCLGIAPALSLAQMVFFVLQVYVLLRFFILQESPASALGWLLGLEWGYYIVGRVERVAMQNPRGSAGYISLWVEAIPLLIFFLVLAGHIALRNFYFWNF